MLSTGKFSVIPVCVCSVTQLYLTLCDPMDYSPPDSFVHGTFQARIAEKFAISSSRGSSQPGDRSCVFCIAGGFFTWWVVWEALCYSYRYLKLILRACWDKGSNEGNKMGGRTNEPLSSREELESHANFLDGLACGSASRNARKMQLKPNS